MFHTRKSVLSSLINKNYVAIGGVHVPKSMSTRRIDHYTITSNDAGMVVASDSRHTYLILQTSVPAAMITSKVTIDGAPYERLCYMPDVMDVGSSPRVYRLEMEAVIKRSAYGSYIITDSTKVTIQSPDGAVEHTVLPPLSEMFSRSTIHAVPELDGVPSYNHRRIEHSPLLDHATDFDELPGSHFAFRGVRYSVSDVFISTFCRLPHSFDALSLVAAAAPLLVVHRLSSRTPLCNSLCTIREDERIFSAEMHGHCRACATSVGLMAARSESYRVYPYSALSSAIHHSFLVPYAEAWQARYEYVSEITPCSCVDAPTAPDMSDEAPADEVASLDYDSEDSLPPLIRTSPCTVDLGPRAPKRRRLNPEEEDSNDEA